MEPLTLLVTALVVGATEAVKSTAGQAIKDAYTGLKKLILDRYGSKGDTAQAVAQLENKPDSPGRKAVAQEELQAAGADQDQELVSRAAELLKLLESAPPAANVEIDIKGTRNVAAGRDIHAPILHGDITGNVKIGG